MTDKERAEIRSTLVVAEVHLRLNEAAEARKLIREAITLLDAGRNA